MDRFACNYNAKLPRFNSRFFQSGSEAVDAFCQDWRFNKNWLCPPVCLIARVIQHLELCQARGTLIVPLWKSSFFWNSCSKDGVHWSSFVIDWVYLPKFQELFIRCSSDVFCSGFWRDQMTPGNRFIQCLTDRLKTMVLSSYITSSQYHRAFCKWKEFAVCKLNETSFPADPFYVALYLQYLLEQAQSPSVINSAFYGIKWAHDMAGVPFPTGNSVV